ncbi:MAG: mobile mystery protein B [Oleiphilus sp.]|nr:MAG: mobile mystery protein B [Oleiphilus sp.]
MSDPLIEEDEASTPLTEEEKLELIPSYISIRSELNEAEQRNILKAEEWTFLRNRDVLSEKFLKDLHKKMLGDVWKWAGQFRKTERNIGVDPVQIAIDLRNLIDDCKCWVKYGSYEPDEIAARFAHRLVKIHPFPNGNGRHSRIAGDALLVSLGQERFSWGSNNLVDAGETRKRYLEALYVADNHDYSLLLKFVRS